MKAWLAALVPLFLFACVVEGGDMLEIVNTPVANLSDCTFRVDEPGQRSTGRYDPTGADGYVIGVVVRNNMESSTFDPIAISGTSDNLKSENNNVGLVGFYTCFYREDDPSLQITALNDKGEPLVNCGALPATQQRFIVASGTVQAGGLRTATLLTVLNRDDLKVLFGAAFDPPNIPQRGAFVDAVSSQIHRSFQLEPPSPASARNVAWGNFPEAYTTRVIVQLQARGKLQNGSTLSSNVFHYPIQIEMGGVAETCGDLVLTQCIVCTGAPCVGNEPTLLDQQMCVVNTPGSCDGECPPSTPGGTPTACQPFAFSGVQADVAGKCLPYEFMSTPTCLPVDGCL